MATTVRTLVWRGRDWNQSKEEDRVKRNSQMEGIGRPMQRKKRSLNMLATVVTFGVMAALSGCASSTGYPTAHVADPAPRSTYSYRGDRYSNPYYSYPSYRRSYYGYSRNRHARRGHGYYPRGHRSYGYYYGGYYRYRH